MTDSKRNTAAPSGVYMQLVTNHQASLYSFIRSLIPHGATVEDLLQETNLTLWEKASEFEAGTNFRAFAFSIARFKVLSHLRDQKRKHWLLVDSELCDELLDRFVNEPSAEPAAQEILRRCLEKLPADRRDLIRRRYADGRSVRDLARMEGKKEGALQQIFFRLRKILRDCIEKSMNENQEAI